MTLPVKKDAAYEVERDDLVPLPTPRRVRLVADGAVVTGTAYAQREDGYLVVKWDHGGESCIHPRWHDPTTVLVVRPAYVTSANGGEVPVPRKNTTVETPTNATEPTETKTYTEDGDTAAVQAFLDKRAEHYDRVAHSDIAAGLKWSTTRVREVLKQMGVKRVTDRATLVYVEGKWRTAGTNE